MIRPTATSLNALLVLVAAAPVALAAGLGAAPDDDCPTPPAPEAVRELAFDSVDATLQRLYAAYADLPGFVDVYFHNDGADAFRPTFVGAVPPEAHARAVEVPVTFDVLASAPEPLGAGPAPDADDALCNGIRPGDVLNGRCSLSFVFRDGASTYISTAGHCIRKNEVALTWPYGRVGVAVFSVNEGVGRDFALIKIDADKVPLVSAEMCHWAGPTAAHNNGGITGRTVYQTGHGGLATLVPPRPRVGVGSAFGATTFQYAGVVIGGDSGSPARLNGGEALGTITHGLQPTGIGIGTRIDRGLALAGMPGLQLATVPYVHGL